MSERAFVTADARQRTADTIARVEANTSGEVVVAVRPRSDRYRHTDYLVGFVLSVMVLIALLALPQPFDIRTWPLDIALAFAAGSLLSAGVPAVARALTSQRVMDEQVARAARAAFVDMQISRTRDRTGLLVFVSLLERRAEVVADIGVRDAMKAADIERLADELDDSIRSGPDLERFLEALNALGKPLARKLRRREDDINELPDMPGGTMRPGAGDMFGGSSSPSTPSHGSGSSDWGGSSSPSSYSGSGGGGGGLVTLPLALLVFGVIAMLKYAQAQNSAQRSSWETTPGKPSKTPPGSARRDLARLVRATDRDFSLVVFEDFAYALFTAYHEARGGSRTIDVAPWVTGQAKENLSQTRRADVKHIVVGAMRVVSSGEEDRNGRTWLTVTLGFEANYTEVDDAGDEVTYYTAERWSLARRAKVKSRPPEKTRLDECPNCGGALEKMQGNVCAFCNKTLKPGAFDWAVEEISIKKERRGPMLTGNVEEQGTDLPTVVARDARRRRAELAERDPSFTWPGFEARVGLIFERLHAGWTSRDYLVVRPFVSDQLFQAQLFWIEEYKRQGLTNNTAGARILDVRIANVTSDKYYDAITVRLFATGKDYTVTERGRVVSGTKNWNRKYSEYWTLIRGRGVEKAATARPECPNCAAELDINMAGNCSYCQAKVTSGQFDWVLSRIEQDEVYSG